MEELTTRADERVREAAVSLASEQRAMREREREWAAATERAAAAERAAVAAARETADSAAEAVRTEALRAYEAQAALAHALGQSAAESTRLSYARLADSEVRQTERLAIVAGGPSPRHPSSVAGVRSSRDVLASWDANGSAGRGPYFSAVRTQPPTRDPRVESQPTSMPASTSSWCQQTRDQVTRRVLFGEAGSMPRFSSSR